MIYDIGISHYKCVGPLVFWIACKGSVIWSGIMQTVGIRYCPEPTAFSNKPAMKRRAPCLFSSQERTIRSLLRCRQHGHFVGIAALIFSMPLLHGRPFFSVLRSKICRAIGCVLVHAICWIRLDNARQIHYISDKGNHGLNVWPSENAFPLFPRLLERLTHVQAFQSNPPKCRFDCGVMMP